MAKCCVSMCCSLVLMTGVANAVAGGDEANPLCPVMEEAIDFSQSMETDDGPVFVCCKGCVGKMKADPAKYETAIAAQRKALAKRPKVQVACPMSGDPIDADLFAEVDGKKIYTCCKNCAAKYAKAPEKYKAGLASSYTYQTKCPVSGEAISPAAFATMPSGFKIYTCCEKCAEKMQANPSEYWPSLKKQGYNVSLKVAMKPAT